jgi:hypothetical protein
MELNKQTKQLKRYAINSIPALLTLLFGFLWLVCSIVFTVKDIFNGINNPWMTISFIISLSIGLYLKTKQVLKRRILFPGIKIPKTKGKSCSKCGKNREKSTN